MATKKTSKKKSSRKISSKDKLSKSARKLIDDTAKLLRQGVKSASKKGHKAHRDFKKQANAFIQIAARRLHAALQGGSKMLKKRIRKM